MAFSGFQDFMPDFGSALQRFIAASPGINVGSGYRDVARQQQLWNNALQKYGSAQAARKWVAPPGRSFHNKRLAADLQYASPAARKWAHENAAQYGLAFPLGNEDWHVELAGARGGGAGPSGGSSVSSVPTETANVLAQALVPPTAPGRADINALADTSFNAMPGGGSSRRRDTDQPRILGGRQETPAVSLETELGKTEASGAPQVTQPPKLLAQLDQSMAPLAELFDIKTIGQAGKVDPRLPPRRRF